VVRKAEHDGFLWGDDEDALGLAGPATRAHLHEALAMAHEPPPPISGIAERLHSAIRATAITSAVVPLGLVSRSVGISPVSVGRRALFPSTCRNRLLDPRTAQE